MQGSQSASNPNEANLEGLMPQGTESIDSSNLMMGSLPGALSAGKSMEVLPPGGSRRMTANTPQYRFNKMQSIQSPFYKHPNVGELRRAQTPNQMSFQSIHSMRSIDAESNNPYGEMNFPTSGAIAEDTASVRSKQSKFKRKHRF